jgi:hypothetical protein
MSASPQRLSALQRRFIAEYMVDFKAAPAARRAGYSPKRADVTGSRLLGNVRISADIRRRCLAIEQRLELTGDDVRRGFARIATDPREVSDGGPSFEVRISALRELGKLFGMYSSKIQVIGSITLVDLLLAAETKTAELSSLPPAEVTH